MEYIGWQKELADAKKLEAAGFGGMHAAPPVLSDLAQQALHCWVFCGGWAPERWAVYGAFYGVDDWHLLVEAMKEIKEHV